MIDIEIDVDTMAASLFVRGIPQKAIPIAETRALNKVIVTVRKEAVQQIHAVRRLKKGTIRQQLQLVRATRRNRVAMVRGSRRPIPLKEYSAKVGGRKGHKRVVINISGERTILEHAFIVDKVGSHVFKRVGDARLPIKKLYGPSLGSALVKTHVGVALRTVIATAWPPVYSRELTYAISKL